MSYKIGSFNVRNLSWGAVGSRNLDKIAEIIKRYDIIALQEVLSEGKILEGPDLKSVEGQAKAYEYSLRSRLGDNWEMCWLDPKTSSKWYPYLGDDSRGEGYVFIWRSDKFSCPLNEKGNEIRPRIIHQYKTDSKVGEMKLMRDPAYGRFRLNSMPNFEVRLITTHIIFGKPSADNLNREVDFGSITMRQNEFNVLARSIYTSISDDHVDVDAVVPYTIILGDYNLNLRESGITTANVPGVLIVDSQKRIVPTNEVGMRDGTYIIKTQQADLSTMNKDADNYVSNYDHFSFDTRTEQNIVRGRPHRLSVAEEMSSYKEYRDTVSDHIPIMLEIDLK